ncbi:hypothetical protein [Paracoccus sp. (in: a-proteobacteria)]|uniref:hypothetical protein n=1 Tax=Paracoccus sp. TaxID=267 RepID=UPI004058A3E4
MTDPQTPRLSQMMQVLRTLQDGQIDLASISTETLTTARTLTALLDLLNRPEDQHAELGQQLAETLRQIAWTTGRTASEVSAISARMEETDSMLTQAIAASEAHQRETAEIGRRLSSLEARLQRLASDLFEDPVAG